MDSLKAEKGAEDSQIMWRVLLETVLATGIFFGLYGAADAVSFAVELCFLSFVLSFLEHSARLCLVFF